jgi:O-antigen ligase
VTTVVVTRPRRSTALAAALAVVMAASAVIFLNPPLRERFWSSITPSGSGERSGLLAAGLNAVSIHPWVGTGLGRFRPAHFAAADSPEEVLEHPGKAHNQFVTLAAEIGLPGVLIFGVLILWLARSMNPALPEGAAGLSAILFFLLLCFFHDPLYHGEFSMAFALVLGAALTRAPMSRR